MRIDSIEIHGLRSIAQETVAFAPVSVFSGPNGSGKTTVVGAVIYALTGRFPGVVGATVDAIRPLMSDPGGSFQVKLHATTSDGLGATVQRGLARDKHELLVHIAGTPRTGKDAEALLVKHFGDVETAIDMFDPEKSLWRMSPEKCSAWMFELCASASGWSVERLSKEMAPALRAGADDWDAKAGRDAASAMELNLARIENRLKAAQRVAREAKVLVDGIAAPTFPPTDEEMQTAEAARKAATGAAAIARKAVDDLREAQARIAKARETRRRLEIEQKAAIAKVALEGAAITLPAAPTDDLDALEADVLAADIALAESSEDVCPTCGGPAAGRVKSEQRQRDARDRLAAANASRALYEERLGHGNALREANLTLQRSLRERLAALPPDEPDRSFEETEGAWGRALDAEKKAGAKVTELRQIEGVAREKSAQFTAMTNAVDRAKELGGLVGKARAVRTAMLRESVAPLRAALKKLDGLAPPGHQWNVHDSGTFGLLHLHTNTIVTVHAMSSGERYRASIALLVATAMVKREPWVGLFLDGFEQVSEDARKSVLQTLGEAVRDRHVDNVFVGGAMVLPPDLPTVGSIVRYFVRSAPSALTT